LGSISIMGSETALARVFKAVPSSSSPLTKPSTIAASTKPVATRLGDKSVSKEKLKVTVSPLVTFDWEDDRPSCLNTSQWRRELSPPIDSDSPWPREKEAEAVAPIV